MSTQYTAVPQLTIISHSIVWGIANVWEISPPHDQYSPRPPTQDSIFLEPFSPKHSVNTFETIKKQYGPENKVHE